MSEVEENKNLIIRLLEKDICAYKSFIPIIRGMNEQDFENFFNGKKSYSYNVQRKQKFLMLVEKVENYQFILDWGYNPSYYPYLEELWVNYICIEDLKKKKDEEIQNFLESNGINYSHWPEYIKSEFKGCIKHTKNTIIYKCKQMYQSLKGIPKYLLDKYNEFLKYLDQIGLKDLRNLAEKVHLDMVGKFLLGGSTVGISTYRWIRNNVIESGVGKLFTKETFSYIYNNLKDIVKTKSFLAVESFITVGNLIFSIYDYYKIKEIAGKAEDFRSRLNEIDKSFQEHITKINYDKVFEYGCDLNKIFKIILDDVMSDLGKLEVLINDINRTIHDCENQKISSGIGIAASAVFAIGGFAAAIITGGASIPATVIHSINSAGNVVSGAIHIKNLVNCTKVAEELNEILKDAQKKRDDIKSIIQKLNIDVSELKIIEQCIPKYMFL